jgi:hypothetical protein
MRRPGEAHAARSGACRLGASRRLLWDHSETMTMADRLDGAPKGPMRDVRLQFRVSQDEEYVRIRASYDRVSHELTQFQIPAHILLYLARKRLADQAAGLPEDDCVGWAKHRYTPNTPASRPSRRNSFASVSCSPSAGHRSKQRSRAAPISSSTSPRHWAPRDLESLNIPREARPRVPDIRSERSDGERYVVPPESPPKVRVALATHLSLVHGR